MDDVNAMINKSLDDIEAVLAKAAGEQDLQKGGDVPPEEVSNDAPEDKAPEEEEAAPEEGAPEEGEQAPEGEEGSEEEAPEEDTDNEGEDAQKSLDSELKSNDSVRKALEVSDFLQGLVSSISTVMENQRADINKSVSATMDTQQVLAKSFQGMVKAQTSIIEMQVGLSKSLKAMADRLERIESQPMVRKSVSSAPATKPLEKSFNASAGGPAAPTNQLSKSQASAMLTAAFEKGDTALSSDILALEGTGDFNALSFHAKDVLGLK